MRRLHDVETAHNATIAATTSMPIDTSKADRLTVQVVYTASAPAAITFVDADVDVDENTITEAAHGYVTGLKVAATTAGVLPAGLSATNYWVIKVNAATFKLASSLADAEAGTAVNITAAAGGGTHTLTPAAASGNVTKLQISNDNSNWIDVASQTVTTTTSSGSVMFVLPNGTVDTKYVRVLYTPSAGQTTIAVYANTVSL